MSSPKGEDFVLLNWSMKMMLEKVQHFLKPKCKFLFADELKKCLILIQINEHEKIFTSHPSVLFFI
jgi:hypothetical protein